MIIAMTEPNSPYGGCTLDTGLMDVEVMKAFRGLRLETEYNETLSICMRDSGFEVTYWGDPEDEPVTLVLNNGVVSKRLNE